MALPVLNFYNLTVLSHCMKIISPYLQGPTLIYHDGTGDINTLAKSLSESHPIVIAKVPEHPDNDELYSIRSAILLAESPEPMTSILRIWPLWKARSRIVVFLNDPSDTHAWIETLWKRTRAADILVAVLSDPPQYFTWFPYKPGECSNVTTIVPVNTSQLFPKKITPPLNNCPIIGVTTPMSPFVIDENHGSESRVFKDLAQKLGMKTVYTALPEGQNVWTVFDAKFQPFGALKLLYENEADVMFSQMSVSYIITPYAEFLIRHITDEYILFCPGPIEAPRTAAILKAFAPRAWTFVIIASLLIYVSTVVLPLVETGHLHPAFVPAIAIILNVPANFAKSKALLIFVFIAYIYSMHITTAYTTSFIVFLSDVPREKPLQSLQDVVDSGFKVQCHIAFSGTLNILSSRPLMKAINQPDRMLLTTLLDIDQVAKRKNCAIAPRISFSSSIRQDKYYDEFDYPRVNMLKDPIFITFLAYYISKGHPLFDELNAIFTRLVEGGFTEHYSFLVEKPNRPHLRNLEPFGIKNVEGPFILLLSLLGACTFVWLCEWVFFWLMGFFIRKEIAVSRSSRRVSWVLGFISRQIKRQEMIV